MIYGLALLGVVVAVALILILLRARGRPGDQAVVEPRRDEIAGPSRAPGGPKPGSSESPLRSTSSSEGRTIANEAARFGDLDWALPLLGKVAAELSSLHAQGIVHGGLTSTNVSVEDDGGGVQTVTLAPAHGTRGDARYQAPENVGAAQATEASDVFAFGVLAYEMITGKHPWPTPPASSTAPAEAAYPASVALDPTLRGLLTRALSLRSAERPVASEIAWLLAAPTSSSFVTSRGKQS